MSVCRKSLILLLAGLFLSAGCGKPPAARKRPPAVVRVSLVQRKSVAPQVELLGTVHPMIRSEVASGAAGKVMVYPVREGHRVKKGDMLAQLRSVTLGIEIEAAKAKLRGKQQRHNELVAGYRKEEIRQTQAVMLRAQADYKYATKRLKRIEGLHKKNAITDDELEEAISAEERAEQALAEARAAHDLKTAGFREEVIAQAKSEFDAQEQEVLRLEDELKKRTIIAPFDGFIVRKHSDVGEWIEKGGTVASLVDLTEVDIVVNVEETLTHLVHLGQEVDVLFDALGDKTYRGRVKEIVPKSDWQGGSRSFPVKVGIKNILDESGLPLMKEGMLARVVLRGKKHEATLVHKDTIVRSSGSPVVYRLTKKNRAEIIPVKEMLSYGEFIEVSGSLTPGERLVSEGNERLRPEQEVKVLDNPPSSSAKGTARKPTNTKKKSS